MNRGQYAVLALESMRKRKDLEYMLSTVRQKTTPMTIRSIDWFIKNEFGFDVSGLSKDTKRRALGDLMELGFVRREKKSYYLVRS